MRKIKEQFSITGLQMISSRLYFTTPSILTHYERIKKFKPTNKYTLLKLMQEVIVIQGM